MVKVCHIIWNDDTVGQQESNGAADHCENDGGPTEGRGFQANTYDIQCGNDREETETAPRIARVARDILAGEDRSGHRQGAENNAATTTTSNTIDRDCQPTRLRAVERMPVAITNADALDGS